MKIYTIYILISFIFNYIPYQIEKNIVWINKIYYVRPNLIIYVIVTDFLISQYFIIYKNIKYIKYIK